MGLLVRPNLLPTKDVALCQSQREDGELGGGSLDHMSRQLGKP